MGHTYQQQNTAHKKTMVANDERQAFLSSQLLPCIHKLQRELTWRRGGSVKVRRMVGCVGGRMYSIVKCVSFPRTRRRRRNAEVTLTHELVLYHYRNAKHHYKNRYLYYRLGPRPKRLRNNSNNNNSRLLFPPLSMPFSLSCNILYRNIPRVLNSH